ncbi:unnamed protein product, partial [marine sediment metagenome]
TAGIDLSVGSVLALTGVVVADLVNRMMKEIINPNFWKNNLISKGFFFINLFSIN